MALLLGAPSSFADDGAGQGSYQTGRDKELPPPSEEQVQRAFEAGDEFRESAANTKRNAARGEPIPEQYSTASSTTSDIPLTNTPAPHPENTWKYWRWWCANSAPYAVVPFQFGVVFPPPYPGPVRYFGYYRCFRHPHFKDH